MTGLLDASRWDRYSRIKEGKKWGESLGVVLREKVSRGGSREKG